MCIPSTLISNSTRAQRPISVCVSLCVPVYVCVSVRARLWLGCHLIQFGSAVVERVAQLSGGKLDMVLLGMGEDGHTASLFPGHALLSERTRLVAPIRDSPKPPPARVTFTLPLITSARSIAFVAAGDGKADPLLWIFKQQRHDVPSGRVRQLRPDTVWFVDHAAVAKL